MAVPWSVWESYRLLFRFAFGSAVLFGRRGITPWILFRWICLPPFSTKKQVRSEDILRCWSPSSVRTVSLPSSTSQVRTSVGPVGFMMRQETPGTRPRKSCPESRIVETKGYKRLHRDCGAIDSFISVPMFVCLGIPALQITPNSHGSLSSTSQGHLYCGVHLLQGSLLSH